MNVYITSGYNKGGAITIHTLSTLKDVDLATYNSTYIYVVPVEGQSTNKIEFTI